MNKIFTLFFVLFSFCSLSQMDTSFYYGGIIVEYGQKFFHDDFNGNLKSIDNIESNSLSIETISLTSISNAIPVNRKFVLSGYVRFSYIIPKKNNDRLC